MQPDLPLDLLICPETLAALRPAEPALIEQLNHAIAAGELRNVGGRALTEPLDGGLLRVDGRMLYPIADEIPVLLKDEAIGVPTP